MSVKIMGIVWDLDSDVIDREEKYVLLAYTDHADHDGNNIYPSVGLISRKTGYSTRSVQSITSRLVEKGFLIPDGKGEKGTNKYRFGGAEFAGGVQNLQGGVQKLQGGGAIATAPESSLTIIEPSLPSEIDTDKVVEYAKKKMDSILKMESDNARKLTYPKRESFPEAIRELIDVFVEISNIKPIGKDAMQWLAAGNDWLEIGATKSDVRGAWDYAKGRFAVLTPHSLTNTIRAYKSGALGTQVQQSNETTPTYVWKQDEHVGMSYDEWKRSQIETR